MAVGTKWDKVCRVLVGVQYVHIQPHHLFCFFSPFLLICHSHVYSPQLVLASSSLSSWSSTCFHQCNQSLQNPAIRPVVEHVDGSGAEFHKLHSEFHLGRGCVLFITTTSWCLEHSRHWINVAGINPLLPSAIRGPKLSWRRGGY